MWGRNLVLIFLCTWHVLEAWHLHSIEKIKDLEVRRALLNHLHMVMFMSINLDEAVDDLKARGKEMVVENFDNLQLGVVWTRFFGLIIVNPVSKRSSFQVWDNLKPFMLWMHFMDIQISHIFKLHHGLNVCCACPCKALDGWAMSHPTFESRHTI